MSASRMRHTKLTAHEIMTLDLLLTRLVAGEPIALEMLPAVSGLADKIKSADGITLHIPA